MQDEKHGDIIKRMEITGDWTKVQERKGCIIEKQSYVSNGTAYAVDGIHVILKPSEQERNVAKILSEKYGKTVELVPRVVYPQGMQTPDYLIDGERFDLKSPIGSGKQLLYNMVVRKRRQSANFIFDITECPLSNDEIRQQAMALYYSRHTRFIDKIVIMRSGEILNVYSRQ